MSNILNDAGDNDKIGVRELFNANSAIFQLYHAENKLIFNEMTRSTRYTRPTL